jgi:Zn-dependent peptidase ImmA (M78 family)/transcriptional regulator with XRE-family HTH domain
VGTSDPRSLGDRIAQARARAGLTQAALAAAVSLDRSVLAKIEGGSRRVTALELARIADVVGERIEWLVNDPPPAIVAHRNLVEPGAPSPVIDREVERVARNVEFLLQHHEELALPEGRPVQRPRTVADAEEAATQARRRLGLDRVEPLLDISSRLAGAGLLVFSVDLGTEAADAASILLARGGIALINGHRLVGRRRLAAAHEFGHHLCVDDYTVDWRIGEQDDESAWESRLDRFARAVLLPADGLRKEWPEALHRGGDLRTAAVLIASAFRVDMSTLSRRLYELGMLGRADADIIRSVRTTKADIVDLNLVIVDELVPPSMPRLYIQAVLDLYRRQTVSGPRALDLLFDAWTEEDLPPLPPLPESAIWQFIS